MYNQIYNGGHFNDSLNKHLPLQYQFLTGNNNPIAWENCPFITYEATAAWPKGHHTVLYKPSSSEEVSNQRQDAGDGRFDLDDF